MAYSIEEEDKMLAVFENIANQPIEQQRPYNEVKNPKPIVESACFEGVKVDFSGWTEDKKKVGKAKTASNPDLAKQSKNAPKVTDVDTKGTATATKGTEKPVTENDTVTEKKEDKQVTKLVTEDASHEAKGEPKAKNGNFDSTAKSTASAQRSKADSNKKFSEESKKQRKIDMFRDFVKSLGVDKESKEAAEKVLKKFDQISKHIGEPGDGKVKPKLEANEQVASNEQAASAESNAAVGQDSDMVDWGDDLNKSVGIKKENPRNAEFFRKLEANMKGISKQLEHLFGAYTEVGRADDSIAVYQQLGTHKVLKFSIYPKIFDDDIVLVHVYGESDRHWNQEDKRVRVSIKNLEDGSAIKKLVLLGIDEWKRFNHKY